MAEAPSTVDPIRRLQSIIQRGLDKLDRLHVLDSAPSPDRTFVDDFGRTWK